MKKHKVYWTTKDGKKIDVDKWDDIQHMRNVLKILISNREEDYFGDIVDTF